MRALERLPRDRAIDGIRAFNDMRYVPYCSFFLQIPKHLLPIAGMASWNICDPLLKKGRSWKRQMLTVFSRRFWRAGTYEIRTMRSSRFFCARPWQPFASFCEYATLTGRKLFHILTVHGLPEHRARSRFEIRAVVLGHLQFRPSNPYAVC